MAGDRVLTFGKRDAQVEYIDRRAAYAVILKGNNVAVVQNARGLRFLPGGGAAEGETPEQTALREIREELGCEAEIIRSLGEAEQYFFAASDNCHYRMEAAFFAAVLADVDDAPAPSGEETLHWMTLDEVREKLFHASHVWAVETAIRLRIL